MKKTTPEPEEQSVKFEESGGNVFADLGLSDPEERLAKAELALAITRKIRALGLNQTEAAVLLGTDQAKVSALMRGKLKNFTYDRLLRFVNRLGWNVRITLTPTEDEKNRGQTLVTTQAA